MFIKEFEVRWSDLDANGHLANSAYINFMSHTRMRFLVEMGFDQRRLAEQRIGPVVFYEHMYYFKEVLPGRPLRVSLEVTGMSVEGRFFAFEHNFYDVDGRNMAHCEMMGGWIDLDSRSLTDLPAALLEKFELAERPPRFKVLTKLDTRKYGKSPRNLDSRGPSIPRQPFDR